MNEQFYNVSANPHVRYKASTHSIMLDVIIALLPATLFGFWNFGVKAIINTVICVAVCVLAEYVWRRCMHQKVTVKDFSAALTGLLLALNLPPEVPFWIPVIGGLFAIIVVKQLFGGLGQNFMNPALIESMSAKKKNKDTKCYNITYRNSPAYDFLCNQINSTKN